MMGILSGHVYSLEYWITVSDLVLPIRSLVNDYKLSWKDYVGCDHVISSFFDFMEFRASRLPVYQPHISTMKFY